MDPHGIRVAVGRVLKLVLEERLAFLLNEALGFVSSSSGSTMSSMCSWWWRRLWRFWRLMAADWFHVVTPFQLQKIKDGLMPSLSSFWYFVVSYWLPCVGAKRSCLDVCRAIANSLESLGISSVTPSR
jgi:hypothetical protein